MIYDLDRLLENIIYTHARLNRSDVDIAFDQPTGIWSAALSRPTVNCWLYDLRENRELRNREWKTNAAQGQAQKRIAPLRFDLTYLITIWTNKVEDEHQLLWRVLAALSRSSLIDPQSAEAEGMLREQPYKIPVKVAQVNESAMTLSDIWSVLDNQMRTGFNVTVTLALDTARGFDAPLVLAADIALGQTDDVPGETLSSQDVTIQHPANHAQQEVPPSP